jgi:glutamate synthase (NADPH/NADH) large chain
MTGGTVVVLGEVGDNFGAGFTGGVAFVYDPNAQFELRVNPDTVLWQRVATAHWENALKALVQRHVDETESRYAAGILNDWSREVKHFWQVVPKDYVKYLEAPLAEEVSLVRA